MDLFVLDSSLRRVAFVEEYESLIWTERYAKSGDLQMLIPSTQSNRALLPVSTQLGLSESDRIMTIESINDTESADGRKMLELKGPELSDIFNDRTADAAFMTTDGKAWVIEDTPGNVMRALFDYSCRTGTTDVGDIIPFLTTGSLYPADTLIEPPDEYRIVRDYADLYTTLTDLAEIWDLGFRLYKGPDTSLIYFDVYAGNDRTTLQTTLPPVIFAPGLDSLQNISEFTSISDSKNVALVNHPLERLYVYAEGTDPSVAGFARRLLTVDASDIDIALGPDLTTALVQRGKDELLKNRSISAFDGEVSQFAPYKYRRDYNLGDLVELRNDDGVTNQMKVTEQIFVSDAQGERSYPTLATKLFITPGSWYAWNTAEVWHDQPDDSDHDWIDA